MGSLVQIGGHKAGFAATTRSDRWWIAPLIMGLGFLAFTIYANVVAYMGTHYWFDGGTGGQGFGGYLSPMYSPVLFSDPTAAGSAPVSHALFGTWPEGLRKIWPAFLPTSPAWLILAGPLMFRGTCYYYRKFYYRSYFVSPPGCAVEGVRPGKYRGETRLFLVQNLHRYTFYIAAAFIVILAYDGFMALFRDGHFGVGVGSVILIINPILLGLYTFGCHSCRHLVGGRVNVYSKSKFAHRVWSRVSALNARHMMWAWISMVWVGFTDFYVRMVSMGVWTDFNTWGS